MTLLEKDRRPITSRNTVWAQKVTHILVKMNASPNKISMWSIFFSLVGAVSILTMPYHGGLLIFSLAILLRLLCNLFDGMVAIETVKPNPLGRIYNEFPDRVTDTVFIVAAGYACGYPTLGLVGALLAVCTAYVRIFGGSLGFEQDFRGPQSKSQRMGVLITASILAQIELWFFDSSYALMMALIIIAAGSFITCVTRTIALKNKILAMEK